MKAIILAYRGSHKTQHPKQMILKPESCGSRQEAAKLVGKKVIWVSPKGKRIEGVISAPHGNSGAVRARFPEKGLPGQALGGVAQIE